MQIESARKLAAAWCDAWNRRDLDAIMEHYADDVEFSSSTVVKRWGITDGWLRGSSKVRENFAIGVKAHGLHFELVDVLLGVNSVCVVHRRESSALVTDLVELDANGKGRRVTACYGLPRRRD
jgi:ketosteroid isomerase-like protein